MKQTLFLFAGIVFIVSCTSHPDANSNEGLKTAVENNGQPRQTGNLLNRIEQASFKYTSSDLFKTGKVSTPRLIFSADTLVHYNGKKHQVQLKYFNVRNAIFGVGSLTTGNNTVLLFSKEKQFHYFEVKGVGVFEFRGTKEDKNYFRLHLNDRTMYFSLSLHNPDVLITEYTVDSE